MHGHNVEGLLNLNPNLKADKDAVSRHGCYILDRVNPSRQGWYIVYIYLYLHRHGHDVERLLHLNSNL